MKRYTKGIGVALLPLMSMPASADYITVGSLRGLFEDGNKDNQNLAISYVTGLDAMYAAAAYARYNGDTQAGFITHCAKIYSAVRLTHAVIGTPEEDDTVAAIIVYRIHNECRKKLSAAAEDSK